ncbi:Laminin subunit gamma-3 [Plecturocebus cupreus]
MMPSCLLQGHGPRAGTHCIPFWRGHRLQAPPCPQTVWFPLVLQAEPLLLGAGSLLALLAGATSSLTGSPGGQLGLYALLSSWAWATGTQNWGWEGTVVLRVGCCLQELPSLACLHQGVLLGPEKLTGWLPLSQPAAVSMVGTQRPDCFCHVLSPVVTSVSLSQQPGSQGFMPDPSSLPSPEAEQPQALNSASRPPPLPAAEALFLKQGVTLSPRLECSGTIIADCSLELLGASLTSTDRGSPASLEQALRASDSITAPAQCRQSLPSHDMPPAVSLLARPHQATLLSLDLIQRGRDFLWEALSPHPSTGAGQGGLGREERGLTHLPPLLPTACNCSGRSEECTFDRELFRSTGHGGRCHHCRDHTAGPHCERCQENFYHWDPRMPCQPCDCHSAGSLHLQCDDTGTCTCKPTVTGWKCDRCLPGFHSISEGGCRPCTCNPAGSLDTCDPRSGRCPCKENVEGNLCDRCVNLLQQTSLMEYYQPSPFTPMTDIANGALSQFFHTQTALMEQYPSPSFAHSQQTSLMQHCHCIPFTPAADITNGIPMANITKRALSQSSLSHPQQTSLMVYPWQTSLREHYHNHPLSYPQQTSLMVYPWQTSLREHYHNHPLSYPQQTSLMEHYQPFPFTATADITNRTLSTLPFHSHSRHHSWYTHGKHH